MNLPQKINDLNFSLITINFHPTDMEAFDFFVNTIFKPNFVFKCPLYCGTLEYDETLNRHLHFVLGYTKNDIKDNFDLRRQLNGTKIKNILKIKNTEFDAVGINCKSLNKPSEEDLKENPNFIKSVEVMKSIGYCLKEDNKNYLTNISQEDLEACYQAYIFSCKKHIGMLENELEYKLLSVGNLLSYMFDSFKKSGMDKTDLPLLETYMIQHHKLSFLKITDKQKTQALKELELHITENPNEYRKYKTETAEFLEKYSAVEEEYDSYVCPKKEMIKEIIYLRKKIQELNEK